MMSENEFVSTLHIQQRKTYWRLKEKARKEGVADAVKTNPLSPPVTINPKEDAFYRRVEECSVCRTLAKRVDELESLLTSARAIAERSGACTAWERFSERLAKAGIGNVTPYTFRIPPSDGP